MNCHSELARNLWNLSGMKLEIPRRLGMTRMGKLHTGYTPKSKIS
jgi:hypothetical protein